ncbi:MAG TPA: hypothetical protein VFE45_05455, partial [Coriobacteriia bacterium]|nr:hypothetical protein [Coriobacteriia bacterium]
RCPLLLRPGRAQQQRAAAMMPPPSRGNCAPHAPRSKLLRQAQQPQSLSLSSNPPPSDMDLLVRTLLEKSAAQEERALKQQTESLQIQQTLAARQLAMQAIKPLPSFDGK